MRLISLDVLRGATVAGMILVNSAAGMKYGAHAAVFPLLIHKTWEGLTLADLVFPGFLTMVGVAIPFSLRHAQGDTRASLATRSRILARGARLMLLGFILSNLYVFAKFDSGSWRLLGVLQRIGIVYAVCALLFLHTSGRTRLIGACVLLLAYWPLTLLPSLDGLPTDIWLRGHNFVASVDRLLLGTHLYVQGPEGYDPEGILSTLPAIAQGLFGIAIGEMLLHRTQGRTRRLAIIGGAMIAVGLAWHMAFPIVKDIWSSPFVLVTTGLVALVLAGLHPLLDRQEHAPGVLATGAIAFGSNAIAAYTLHEVTAQVVTWDLLLAPFRATRAMLGDPLASLLPILIYLALIWAAMEWLRRKGWIIKI